MEGPQPQGAVEQQRSIITLHPVLLKLTPNHWEELYFGQFEALDMINCLICPIFFANMLSRWPKDLLTFAYGAVLALKGYQLMLLTIPAARERQAHRKARYWIILAERILRQWVATPLLGRGPRFVRYLYDTAAANPGAGTAVKLAMLTSGITHATWNAFCLPLDFVSGLVINVVFFCINTSSALCQIAYPMAMLVARCRRLLWIQLALECIASAAVWPVHLVLQGLKGLLVSSDCTAGVAGSSACPAVQEPGSAGRLTMAEQLAQPSGLAPDLETLAGRFVLALSLALLLVVVLYLPLLFAWRLELHFKSRFVAHAVRRGGGRICGQLPGGITAVGDGVQACEVPCGGGSRSAGSGLPMDGACAVISGSRPCVAGASLSCKELPADRSNCSSCSSTAGCGGAAGSAGSVKCSTAVLQGNCSSCSSAVGCGGAAGSAGSVGGSTAVLQGSSGCTAAAARSVHVSQLGSTPVLPPLSGAVLKHLVVAAGVCFLLGEGFMALCIASPAVKGLLWPQIPLGPAV